MVRKLAMPKLKQGSVKFGIQKSVHILVISVAVIFCLTSHTFCPVGLRSEDTLWTTWDRAASNPQTDLHLVRQRELQSTRSVVHPAVTESRKGQRTGWHHTCEVLSSALFNTVDSVSVCNVSDARARLCHISAVFQEADWIHFLHNSADYNPEHGSHATNTKNDCINPQ